MRTTPTTTLIIAVICLLTSSLSFAQTECTLANFTSAYILNANDYPYTSPGSGITVSATWPGVSTLNNFSYQCNGQTFNTAAPAWWINNASQVVTLTFSQPVTSFSVTVNGTNSGEEFYFASNTGTVSLANYCTLGWTLINGGTGLRYNNATTTGNLITVRHPTGETVFRMTHSGTGSGSRYAVLDCIIPAILPITLTNFDANCDNGDVSLVWSTSSEINNDYFTIEKSIDGKTFEPIGTVNGAGNSNQPLNYEFMDYNGSNRTTYYRLKQTDFNGDYSYSDVVAKSCSEGGIILIAPNPANNSITILHDLTTPQKVTITDMRGRIVYSENYIETSVDVSAFESGIYFIQLQGEQVITQKFVKQ